MSNFPSKAVLAHFLQMISRLFKLRPFSFSAMDSRSFGPERVDEGGVSRMHGAAPRPSSKAGFFASGSFGCNGVYQGR